MNSYRISFAIFLGMLLSLTGCRKTPPPPSPTEKPTNFRKVVPDEVISQEDFLTKISASNPPGSDHPLKIKVESFPVPQEIQGPFPADADWRTSRPTPEKKEETKKTLWKW